MTGLATLAMVGGAGAARADTVFTFNGDLSGSKVVSLLNGDGQTFGVYAGRYRAQLGPAQGQGDIANIFCVDFNHEIHLNDYYTANTQHLLTGPAAAKGTGDAYYNGGLASALVSGDYGPTGTLSASQRAGEVAFLADSYLNAGSVTFTQGVSGSTNLNDNLAAVSLSIWDIMQDGGTGLGTGAIRLAPGSASLSPLTDYYEAQAAQHAGFQSSTAYWIQAPRDGGNAHFQDYVVEGAIPQNVPAVPEPGPQVPMLLGAGGLAALVITRRRKA